MTTSEMLARTAELATERTELIEETHTAKRERTIEIASRLDEIRDETSRLRVESRKQVLES